MSAIVKYSNGATMSYSLNAFMPFEGYRVAFNGEQGRLDVRDQSGSRGKSRETRPRSTSPRASASARSVPFAQGDGGHGGGDDRLRDQIFRQDRRAGAHEAARLARRRDVVPHRHRRPQQHRGDSAR